MPYSFRRFALAGLLVAGLTAGSAFAQDTTPATPPTAKQSRPMRAPDPDRQLKHLTKALNLTADQQNQIKPILTDRQQQMQNLRSDPSLSPKDKRAKMMGIRQDSQSKLEAVLNDQQKQQFEQLQAQHKGHGHHGKGTAGAGTTPSQPQS
jgi:Spy/CpxP family protein refolding chaperone